MPSPVLFIQIHKIYDLLIDFLIAYLFAHGLMFSSISYTKNSAYYQTFVWTQLASNIAI